MKKSTIATNLIAGASMLAMTTAANAEKYDCSKKATGTLEQAWKSSDYRESLANPKYRGGRGENYAKFVDTFYRVMDESSMEPKNDKELK